MHYSFLQGIGVALVTPFNDNKSIDFQALENLTNHIIAGGAGYLVVMGTTGESVVLDASEKLEVTQKILSVNRDRLPVMLGIGGNNTKAVVEQIKSQNFSGISGLLSVSPYYNKPGQKGIYEHFIAVADASPVPVIIYNVPGRTGSTISASTTISLAENHSNIIATKEASGDMDAVMEIIKNKPDDFYVISGDDLLTLPMIAMGADGVISVIANALPRQMSEMVRQALENNFDIAREMHYQLMPLIKMIFREGSPTGIKSALSALNIIENEIRLPLVTASSELNNEIASALKFFA